MRLVPPPQLSLDVLTLRRPARSIDGRCRVTFAADADMALIDRLRKGDEMRRKSLFALLAFATAVTAVVAGMGASAAFAGESTGNCGNAATDPAGLGFKGSDKAAANCKGPLADPGTRVSNGNSWCSYSGQNDHPEGSANKAPVVGRRIGDTRRTTTPRPPDSTPARHVTRTRRRSEGTSVSAPRGSKTQQPR